MMEALIAKSADIQFGFMQQENSGAGDNVEDKAVDC